MPPSSIPAVDPAEDAQALTRNLSYEQILVEQGVRRRGSGLVRKVHAPYPPQEIEQDGKRYLKYRMEERPVALSIEDAQAQAADFYHPGGALNSNPDVPAGWYRYGRKREIDYPKNLGSDASPWLEDLVEIDETEDQSDAV
jgi:hypothetical protein